jgi:hypothetical protein
MPIPFDDLFRARCEARALLWQAGELTLHEAVDELERWSRDRIDVDGAQAIMAAAFEKVRLTPLSEPGEITPPPISPPRPMDEYEGLPSTFAAACRAADARQPAVSEHTQRLRNLMASTAGLDAAWQTVQQSPSGANKQDAPPATVEALMYQLREGGTAALAEASAKRRLAQLSQKQVALLGERLRWRAAVTVYAVGNDFERSWRRWTQEEVNKLLSSWIKIHG